VTTSADSEDADPLPISLVAHTVFCERRAWLEAVGERVQSLVIEAGSHDHRRVDERADERLARRRSVTVEHPELGLVGRCDVVSIVDDGVELVEFKAAPLRDDASVTEAQRVQLALQRLCLERGGQTVVGQSVYVTTKRQLLPVDLSREDLDQAREWVELTRQVVTADQAPAPLVDDPRCTRCSHVSVCLPDEHRGVRTARRIAVRDPHGDVLHVTTPGSRASLRKGRVIVSARGEEIGSIPIERVEALVLHGNADASSALIRELLWNDRVIVWCSWRGKAIGYARPADGPNGGPRLRQHVVAARGDIKLARELVGTKVSNQTTLLRRNSRDDAWREVQRMRELAKACRTAKTVTELFGLEGEAAAIYFARFPAMFSEHSEWCLERWSGRHGRGATDPINVALNFTYGLLLGDVVRAVIAAGLDPHAGFLHSSGRNKPALGLDLMEQFRPVIADRPSP
jgi:CRISPR-associated protein Cas1